MIAMSCVRRDLCCMDWWATHGHYLHSDRIACSSTGFAVFSSRCEPLFNVAQCLGMDQMARLSIDRA